MSWLDNLLGLNDPSMAGRTAFGAGLLSAAGPSKMPISTGQAIAQGLLGAQGAANTQQQNIRRDQLAAAQIEQWKAENQARMFAAMQPKPVWQSAGGGAIYRNDTGEVKSPDPKDPKLPDIIAALDHAGIGSQTPAGRKIIEQYYNRPPAPQQSMFTFLPTAGGTYGAADARRGTISDTGVAAPVKPATSGATFRDTSAIRKEFENRDEVKSFRQAYPVYQSLNSVPDTPAGDLNFVYAVGKILDPQSVVREGEMKLVIQSGSPLNRLLGTTNWIVGQARLTAQQREQLKAAVGSRMTEYQNQFSSVASEYADLAARNGLNPQDVILNRQGEGAQQQANPAGGQVIDFNSLPKRGR